MIRSVTVLCLITWAGAVNTCTPKSAGQWYALGCVFSHPTATTVDELGTYNRVTATTSCEVSCPVDSGSYVVSSQSGLTEISQENIRAAVDLSLTDPGTGTATYGEMKWWDTGAVTDMSYLFCGWDGSYSDESEKCTSTTEKQEQFDFHVSHWDVSEVVSLEGAFKYALSFNGSCYSNWDTSKVVTLREAFKDARAFKGNLAN